MENLKVLRKAHNKTLKDVAIAFNTSPQVISRYELGQAEPDFATLIKLADYFGVSIDYLLGHDVVADNSIALRTDYEIAFLNKFGNLINNKEFNDLAKLYTALNDVQKGMILGFAINLLQSTGINPQVILNN